MEENTNAQDTKFCKECGAKIARRAVICPHCGCQVVEIEQTSQPKIVINNSNQNQNSYSERTGGKKCNKWTSLILCLLLGCVGGHKFYEGKIGAGLLYLFTGGLFVIGAVIDFFNILGKPNPYTVY